ncbi:hypothetical protein Bhyg_02046, partial [Pseudolycoriella hygida]
KNVMHCVGIFIMLVRSKSLKFHLHHSDEPVVELVQAVEDMVDHPLDYWSQRNVMAVVHIVGGTDKVDIDGTVEMDDFHIV